MLCSSSALFLLLLLSLRGFFLSKKHREKYHTFPHSIIAIPFPITLQSDSFQALVETEGSNTGDLIQP